MKKNKFKELEDIPVQCISFEREEVPDSWKVENGGKLSLSAKHTKHGEKSLKWKWEKDSILRAENPKNLKEAGESERGGIKGWVYNEKPINDKITFAFGSKEEIERNNPRYKFDFYLNYKGWRAFWINFEEDAKNPNYDKKEDLSLEVMIISTPAERKTGDLYFDVFEFVKSMNYGRSGDYQTPFSRGKGKAHKTLHYSKKEPYYPLPEKITAEEKKNFDIIDERVRNWLLGEDLNVSNEITDRAFNRLQELIEIGQEEFEHLNLEVDDKGNIKGPGLFAHKTNREPTFGRYIFPKVLLPLTYDYKLNGNEESKDKVLKIFDYIYDQGWAEGSANGTLFLTHNRAAGFYYSLYLMKDELEETGRLERVLNAAHWYLSFGKAFEKQGEDYFETNADEMRTRMVYCLLYLLTLEDTPRKVQYMKSWLDWFNSALKIAHGYADTIKPDYVGFHHRGIISCAYAPDALEMGAALAYFLHGTEFSADVKVIDNLKNGLKTQFIMANKYDTPLATGARFLRGAINNKIAAGYVYLARVLENMEPADKKAAEEMAGIFMKYWDPESEYFQDGLYPSLANYVQFRCNPGRYQSMLKMAEKNYEPIDNPEGFWMKPYGALAIHRREDWMVTTKGWSQYVWNFEGHPASWATHEENVYGKYISYGNLQILSHGNPVNTADSGYKVQNGWDWTRWPGTTTKKLTLDKLYDYPGKNFKDRHFSDQTFVGGVSSEGQNGMFVMNLHDIAYDESFWAIKSYFYFGNEIICLGSGIKNNDKDYITQTTLFQSFMPDKNMPIWVNGDKIKDFPYKKEFNLTSNDVKIVDPYNNGYIIAETQAEKLNLIRKKQKSRSGNNSDKVTSGDYSTCWFDHGIAPENEGYEYVILVQGGQEELSDYNKTESYEILKKDEKAHIINHKKTNTTAYAVFDENYKPDLGLLKEVSSPVMIMIKERKNENILSLADPDLRLPKYKSLGDIDEAWSESEMEQVVVKIKGKWQMKESSAAARILNQNNEVTEIEFDCVHGKTVEISLY